MRTGWIPWFEWGARFFVWAFGLLLAFLTVLDYIHTFLTPDGTATTLEIGLIIFFIAALVTWGFDLYRMYPPRRRRARRNRTNQPRKRRGLIWNIAIGATFALGIFIVVCPASKGGICTLIPQLIPALSEPWDISMLGLGLTFIALAIALISLRIAEKSGERMRAMANLEFNEKIAVIETYIARVKAKQNVVVEAVYNDIKAAKQLKEYVKHEIEQELNKKIQELIDIAKQKRLKELEHRLQDLQKE